MSCVSSRSFYSYDYFNKDYGRVHFSRVSNLFGMAINYDVYIDKEYVGHLSNGDYFISDLEPGEHSIMLTIGGFRSAEDTHKKVYIKAGRNYEFIVNGVSKEFGEVY